MEFDIKIHDNVMIVDASGSITSANANLLEQGIIKKLNGIDQIVIDFEDVDYISSAGARLLLMLEKKMNKINGELIIKNTGKFVKDVLDQTGFSDILNIQ